MVNFSVEGKQISGKLEEMIQTDIYNPVRINTSDYHISDPWARVYLYTETEKIRLIEI